MKDGYISKLTITETKHQATQYKKIIDTLPILCADKNYRCSNDVLCTQIDLDEADSTPPYPNSDLWSNTYDVEIKTVDRLIVSLGNSNGPVIIVVEQRIYVFDANLQSKLLLDFDQKSKIKSQEYSKFVAKMGKCNSFYKIIDDFDGNDGDDDKHKQIPFLNMQAVVF